jgi:hypothetical protein
MAAPGLDELHADFEAGLGQKPRPRADSAPPSDLHADFEAGLQPAAPRRPASAAPPRLPFVGTAQRPEEALFTDAPIEKPKKKSAPRKPIAIPKVAPLNMGGQEPEEAAYTFSQRQFKQLPESLRSPDYKPAEGGRVSKILQVRAQTFQGLKGKRGQIEGKINQWAAQVTKDHATVQAAKAQLLKQGGTKQEWAAMNEAVRTVEKNRQRLNEPIRSRATGARSRG